MFPDQFNYEKMKHSIIVLRMITIDYKVVMLYLPICCKIFGKIFGLGDLKHKNAFMILVIFRVRIHDALF